jgi:hypothetical protein
MSGYPGSAYPGGPRPGAPGGGYPGAGGGYPPQYGGAPQGGGYPPSGFGAPPVNPLIAQWFSAVDQDRWGQIMSTLGILYIVMYLLLKKEF